MAAELLLDTGAFVALIDRDEKAHAECVAALESWAGPIATTEAVLTETIYLVGPRWRDQKNALEFVLRGAFQLVPSSVKSLQRVAVLMERYRIVPMDFADATLVAWARSRKSIGFSHWTGVVFLVTASASENHFKSSLDLPSIVVSPLFFLPSRATQHAAPVA